MKINGWQATYFISLFLLLIVGLPFPTHADTGTLGGFPTALVWVSKASPVEGDTVQISTPVYNASSIKIAGDAVFTVDGKTLGKTHFELASGESKIASTAWTTTVGTHTLQALTENTSNTDSKETVSLSRNTTDTITIVVTPAPPKPIAVQILNDATSALSNITSATLPIVGSVAGTVFNQTEALRQSAATALQNSLADTPAQNKTQGSVLGAETYRAPQGGLVASVASAPSAHGAMRALKQTLLFLVSYEWIFYPLLIILLLGTLYLLGKGMSQKHSVRK